MKALFVFLVTILSLSTFASTYGLSTKSHFEPIKSCYRWMGFLESLKWRNGKIHSNWIDPKLENFDRTGRSPIIYCWKNATGAVRGGKEEYYGQYLVRIDFVDDAVFYDRVTNKYTRLDGGSNVPDSFKKGIDTEVMYANYTINGLNSFQEYTIRNSNVIKSWALVDTDLKETFKLEMKNINSFNFKLEDFHFYLSYYETLEQLVYVAKEKRAVAKDSYLFELMKHQKAFDEFGQSASDLFFKNEKVRESID